jgi:hypothetical protein
VVVKEPYHRSRDDRYFDQHWSSVVNATQLFERYLDTVGSSIPSALKRTVDTVDRVIDVIYYCIIFAILRCIGRKIDIHLTKLSLLRNILNEKYRYENINAIQISIHRQMKSCSYHNHVRFGSFKFKAT